MVAVQILHSMQILTNKWVILAVVAVAAFYLGKNSAANS